MVSGLIGELLFCFEVMGLVLMFTILVLMNLP